MMDYEKVQILDRGYVQLIETWGSDERIIESARMSTNKGFLGWGPRCPTCNGNHSHGDVGFTGPASECSNTQPHVPGDEKLLRFLYENKHSTPFEFGGMTIEVQAPIFVFREWHRHRTQSYNEMSARYTPLPDENYMPTVERCLLVEGTKNKQAGVAAGSSVLTHENALKWLEMLAEVYDHAETVYQYGLKIGIPKELARLPVPVARYSRMRATTDLRNWLAFLTLRMAPNAQWEIRQFANEVGRLIAQAFPRTWELFAG